MTAREGSSTEVKPLTKRVKATGQLYARRPEVQSQLEKLTSLEIELIFSLASNKNKQSEDYLFDETICYLLREAQIRADYRTIEILYLELNRRIWKLVKSFYGKFNNFADFEDFGQKVELAVIEKIFDIAADSADYAQVNFGDFVITQANVIWRASLKKIKKERELFLSGQGPSGEEEKPEPQFEAGEISVEDKLVLREGISKLPPNILEVVVLILDGWQIESKDENEPTISKYLKVSSRTVRNRLREAREILAGYEGGVRK